MHYLDITLSRFHFIVLFFNITLLFFSPPPSAETVISCPTENTGSKSVSDDTPSELFRVTGCWCAATNRVLEGMDKLGGDAYQSPLSQFDTNRNNNQPQPDPAYQNARSIDDIRAELIRVLGMQRGYEFIASRDPDAARGSTEVRCLTDQDIDRFVVSVKNLRDEQNPLGLPPVKVDIKIVDTDSGAKATPPDNTSGNNAATSTDAASGKASDYGEANPDELAPAVKPATSNDYEAVFFDTTIRIIESESGFDIPDAINGPSFSARVKLGALSAG
jgi:hypothetical protein